MSNAEKQNLTSISSSSETLTPETLKTAADGWWRTQSATIALLKHVYGQIGASEKLIAEQDKRIRELEDLAATDPLTSLMNRRGFEKFFEMEQARIRRQHSPGALLILIDLDLFKPINDTYGHLAGDACLKLVSKKLLQSIRMLDGAARLGGDEFSLLLTQLEPDNALQHLEKIRLLLSNISLEWQGKKINFSTSVGAALVKTDSAYDDIYQSADKDLYTHKKQHHRHAARR